MPIVNIGLVKDSLTDGQKTDLIHRVTEAVVEIVGSGARDMVAVRLDEIPDGNFAIGGHPVTAADLYLRFTTEEHREGLPAPMPTEIAMGS